MLYLIAFMGEKSIFPPLASLSQSVVEFCDVPAVNVMAEAKASPVMNCDDVTSPKYPSCMVPFASISGPGVPHISSFKVAVAVALFAASIVMTFFSV